MVSTRGITQVTAAQNQKEVTINEADQSIEDMANATVSITVTGDFTVSDPQWISAIRYALGGTPAGAFDMRLPATSRLIIVDNASGQTTTVGVDPGEDGFDGTTVDVEDGTSLLLYSDGTDTAAITTGGTTSLVDWKDSVRVATTANVTLSGEQTIDGVTTSTDRILVKDNSTASQNGIYVTAAGSWTRAIDFDADAEVTASAAVAVEEGTANADKIFLLTTNDPITVGSTSLVFAAVGTGGSSEVVLEFALSDETTTLTAGTKLTTRMPFAGTLNSVRASVVTASTSGVVTVDVNESGTTVLSTKLTIDQDEKTSQTAATPPVISDSALADDAEISFDIDGAGVGAAGLKVRLYITPS